WEQDFVPTSQEVRKRSAGRDVPEMPWSQVDRYLTPAAEKIRVQVVNSDMRDAIDYEANAEHGLSIIAIGVEKLSRGLTLEGLSVSYFFRASRMYDSLMQMGRWFGYSGTAWLATISSLIWSQKSASRSSVSKPRRIRTTMTLT